jgi:hypothetical protein
MSFDPAVSPLLTPYNIATTPSFGLPSTSNVIGQDQYNMSTVYSGAGGSFEIRPTRNLLGLAQLATNGVIIAGPANTILTRQLTPGDGSIAITNGDGVIGDIGISVQPNTTVQQVIPQVNGVQFGQPRSNINFVPGPGINLFGADVGAISTITISSPTAGYASNADYYVVTQAAGDLLNSTNLGGLTSGLLKQTVTSGSADLAIATPNVDYQSANAYLTEIAALTPTNGSLLYFQGGTWITINPSVNPGWVLATASPTSLTWTAAGSGDVSQIGNNVFTGTNTFNVNLPTSTETPTLSTQLITKAYADATYVPGLTASITTSSITPTNIFTVTVPANGSVTINGFINAVDTTNFTDSTGGIFNATVISVASTAAVVGSPIVTVNASSTGIFNVVLSGSTLSVQATAPSTDNYQWNAVYSVSTII